MEHDIDTGEAAPKKSHHVSYHFIMQREDIINYVQEMAKNGIIQPSNSPCCAPAVRICTLGKWRNSYLRGLCLAQSSY